MDFITYINSEEELQTCQGLDNVKEVLIAPAFCSRIGTLQVEEAASLATEALKNNLKPVLVWDVLTLQSLFSEIAEQVRGLAQKFNIVRVRDTGAAMWVKENLPEHRIQLELETGNHNLEALQGWVDCFKERLDRLILSIELPEGVLVQYCNTLDTPIEILGAGRIQLFYTPRSLLSYAGFQSENNLIEVFSQSQESHNRPFPTIESKHGTLMYLNRDQFILDKLENLEKAGLNSVRIDLRGYGESKFISNKFKQICNEYLTSGSVSKSVWPNETIAPFFKSNNTMRQLQKKKALDEPEVRERILAKVVSAERDRNVVFLTQKAFTVNEKLRFMSTTGELLNCRIDSFRDTVGNRLVECSADQVIVSNWFKKAVIGTVMYISS